MLEHFVERKPLISEEWLLSSIIVKQDPHKKILQCNEVQGYHFVCGGAKFFKAWLKSTHCTDNMIFYGTKTRIMNKKFLDPPLQGNVK